ncbi:ECF RNA polymerase sigma factor SigJ [Halioglobus japonicus]|nr:ECF RNA polymerase sigma factor SigJ [Halioglobus japonicus]
MNDSATIELFEQQRPRLLSLAYRMLGEIQAAEDIVQESWLRWSAAPVQKILSPTAWLTRVATRLAIDQLRSARQRREVYAGPWLPEPIINDEDGGPGHQMALAQECELALLWSLERLAEEERAAFLLSQVFETSYADIARTLDKSEQACRQLVSRARQRLQAASPRFDTTSAQLESTLLAFATAAASGDKEEVLRLLAPDVLGLTDGGGIVSAARIPLQGPERVAQVFTHIASKRSAGADELKLLYVNGQPALVQLAGGESDMIFTLRLNQRGEICWLYTLRNPQKLAKVRALGKLLQPTDSKP